MLTHERLIEELDYDESTGVFTRKSGKTKGKVAGSMHHEGYIRICLLGRYESAHRLAWLFVHKQMPSMSIDHINGNKSDNRICNLRIATARQNSQNRVRPTKANKSGFLGVCWVKAKKKFKAQIVISGKDKQIGLFNSPEEAHQAYLEAKRIHHEFCSI